MSGELFHATRGGGAWLGESRLIVNAEPSPAGALLATGFGYDPATHAGDLARVARVMPLARDIRRIGAASLDLAFVAAGRLDGYFERGLAAVGPRRRRRCSSTRPEEWSAGCPPTSTVACSIVAAAPALFETLLALATD